MVRMAIGRSGREKRAGVRGMVRFMPEGFSEAVPLLACLVMTIGGITKASVTGVGGLCTTGTKSLPCRPLEKARVTDQIVDELRHRGAPGGRSVSCAWSARR